MVARLEAWPSHGRCQVNEIVSVSLQFLGCGAVICYAGAKLSRYGDRIADITGWTGSWVGLALIATVTSLPELATGISAVAFAGTPEMAVGDILGSCVINLALLALIERLCGKRSIYGGPTNGYVLSLSWAILMLAILAAAFGSHLGRVAMAHVAATSPILVLVYFLAVRSVFKESGTDEGPEGDDAHSSSEIRALALRFFLAAAAVVAAASFLPFAALRLAELTGLGASFVGTLLVACATSLPELVVTITAVRIGAVQMAIAGLLGSNLINLALLAIDDLFFLKTSLFSIDPAGHAISLLAATAMSAMVIISALTRAKPAWGGLTAGGWVLLMIFLGNSYYSYTSSGNPG